MTKEKLNISELPTLEKYHALKAENEHLIKEVTTNKIRNDFLKEKDKRIAALEEMLKELLQELGGTIIKRQGMFTYEYDNPLYQKAKQLINGE